MLLNFLERHPAVALLGLLPPFWVVGLPLAIKEGWAQIDIMFGAELFFPFLWPLAAHYDLAGRKEWREHIAKHGCPKRLDHMTAKELRENTTP